MHDIESVNVVVIKYNAHKEWRHINLFILKKNIEKSMFHWEIIPRAFDHAHCNMGLLVKPHLSKHRTPPITN